MRLYKILHFIFNHPLAKKNIIKSLTMFLKWQIGYRINPYPVLFPFVENTKLLVSKNMTGATGNIYTGLHEFNDMAFLLHFLQEQDGFIDIGANIGSYTILASGVCKANSICFEPIPNTFRNLQNNIFLNQLDSITKAHNIGLGNKKGMLKFSADLDTVNHVLSSSEDGIDVVVDTLDNVVSKEFEPKLIKIDVEGFELPVLQGASNILKNISLKAIIIELNGSCGRYGFDENDIDKILKEHHFLPFEYYPFERKLQKLEKFKTNNNTLYIRDLDFVKNRILNSKKIKIFDTIF